MQNLSEIAWGLGPILKNLEVFLDKKRLFWTDTVKYHPSNSFEARLARPMCSKRQWRAGLLCRSSVRHLGYLVKRQHKIPNEQRRLDVCLQYRVRKSLRRRRDWAIDVKNRITGRGDIVKRDLSLCIVYILTFSNLCALQGPWEAVKMSKVCVLSKTGSRSSNPSSKRRVVLRNIEEEQDLWGKKKSPLRKKGPERVGVLCPN